MRPVLRRLVLAVGLASLAGLAPEARAQYFRFGKNRVQYEAHDWRYVQTAHFDVYFYERAGTAPGGRVLAEFAAEAAEEAWGEVAALFAYTPEARIPVLVYQTHNDFAVTNAVELPVYAEGIGGVTEALKNRVAVPFTGDWRELRRVVRHELVHAVLNQFYYGGTLQAALRTGLQLRLPAWFNEGLAEYVAFGWDATSDLHLRDAVLHGYLPPIARLDGYFAYRGGQGVWDYVAAEYGREKVAEILHRVRATRSVERGVFEATGLTLGELSDRWHAAVRQAYYPEAAAREALDDVGRPLASGPGGGRWHAAPALAPQGDRVAFVAATDALFDVVVAETGGDGPARTLVDGQDNTAFESLRILTPGLAWDPSGTRLAVATKSGRGDAIAVVDARTGGTVRRYRVPGVDAVLGVAWSPDSLRLAFEGTAGAHSDVWTLDLASGRATNLTNDLFSDHDPAWSPDGRALVFHSDRGDATRPGRPRAAAPGDLRLHDHIARGDGAQFDLYRLRLDAPGAIERLTATPGVDETAAEWAGPDRVLFLSDRNGVPNLWALDPATGDERPLSDLGAGLLGLSTTTDGSRAAVLALDRGTPRLYLLRNPAEHEPASAAAGLAPTVWAQRATGAVHPPAPALALAAPPARDRNPFLRDAADGLAYGAPPPAPPRDAVLDSLVTAYLASNGPQPGEAAPGLGAPAAFLVREPRPYRLAFSPDLVYAGGGYDTVFGVQGVTQMRFSDLLGNYRLTFATNLVLDLRNADYSLGYAALGRRADRALQAFHLARELPGDDGASVYRYRNYGLVGGLSYPLDKFRRVEGSLALLGVALADLSDLGARPRVRRFVYPRLTYTSDHATPGPLGPAGGNRWAVELAGSPGPSVNFATVLADGRRYVALAPARLGPGYGLAFRLSGGASFGPDPQRFYAAGVPSWLNPSYESLPIANADDLVLATPVLPLRGFGFNEASGDRFVLANAEVRLPLAAAVLPGPLPLLPLYNLQAVAFADAGVIAAGGLDVWRTDEAGRRVFDDVLVGAGAGLRTVVLGYPVRADWAWPFDGAHFGTPRLYLSLGLDF